MTSFPRKVFTSQDMDKPLDSLGINVFIGTLLDDRLKENLKNPETLKGCPLYSLSCLSVCLSACDLQSTPFGLET